MQIILKENDWNLNEIYYVTILITLIIKDILIVINILNIKYEYTKY